MNEFSNIKSLIIITGIQRSGTTLCGQILGAHPSCLLIDETDNAYNWFDSVDNSDLENTKNWPYVLKRALRKYIPAAQDVRTEDRKRLSPNVQHLVLKAPNLTYRVNRLADMVIPISIVHVIRDPRAVVASIQSLDDLTQIESKQRDMIAKLDFSDNVLQDILAAMSLDRPQHLRLAALWKFKSGLFSEFERLGLNHLIVQYEDLVRSPSEMIDRLYRHCGLDGSVNNDLHHSIMRGRGPGLTERARPVDMVSLSKWKDRLSPLEADEIITESQPLAGHYNYSFGRAQQEENLDLIDRAKLSSPIILTGRGGSGTRLLSEIFSNQDMFLGNRMNPSKDSMEWVDLIYEIGARSINPYRDIALANEVSSRLLRSRAKSILSMAEETKAWGLKLPETILIIPQLLSAFPNAKVIHLVRHPVTSSLRRTHMTSRPDNIIGKAVLHAAYDAVGRKKRLIREDEDYIRNAITWTYQVGTLINFAEEKLNPAQYLCLKYEDIILDSQSVAAQVDTFTGLARNDPFILDISPERISYHSKNDPRIEKVWDICGPTAERLGYSKQAFSLKHSR